MKKKFLFLLIGLGLVLGLSWKVNQARSLSLHFGDEEDHITFAYYINQGYQLHRDLQNNHQPLVYFSSAAIQRLAQPENIFMLIRRHRQVVWLYGAIWSLLIVSRFQLAGLAFVLLFEFLKYYLFGNILLMETLAVYPGAYLFWVMLETWFKEYIPRRPELIFLGLCSFLIFFNMVPMWPWLILVWLIYLIKLKKQLLWSGLGLLICTLALFSYRYSPIDWFRETIRNNFFYAIPQLSPFHTIWDWLKMIGFPFLAFFTKQSLQAKFISLFFSGYLAALGYLIYKKSKQAIWFSLIYIFLLLANNRVLSPGSVYYHGFHLLPWLGLIVVVFVFSLSWIKKALPLFLVWGLILMLNKNMVYFIKTDVNHEYYVNYSTLDDFNFAIKNLVNPGDRLAVPANEPILYWNTGAELPGRQVVYGGWEPLVNELNNDYQRIFYGDNPPEIIYGGDEPQLLAEKYVNIPRNGKATELFVRKDKFETITPEQWQALESRGFNHEN